MPRLIFVTLSCFTFLAGAAWSQPASGQDQFLQQVRAQLDAVAEALVKKGYTLTTQVYTGELNQGRERQVSVQLRGGVAYAIVGVCDQDCKDLDMVLADSFNREVARDTGPDDVPAVEVTPAGDGAYGARVVMVNCGKEPCRYGVGVYARVPR